MNKIRFSYISRSCVAFLLNALFAAAALAQSMGSANYWVCETNGVDGGRASTQARAAANWLAHFEGKFMQSGPCGALGTSSYNFCPISDRAGDSEGNMDVHLVCMPGGALSADGLNCPGQYYVSSDVTALYPTASAACTRGWARVAVVSGQGTKAVASYANGTCWLSLGGSLVGTVVIRNAASWPPSDNAPGK